MNSDSLELECFSCSSVGRRSQGCCGCWLLLLAVWSMAGGFLRHGEMIEGACKNVSDLRSKDGWLSQMYPALDINMEE